MARWAALAPEGFLFAWKVSRFVSHNKKLKDCAASVDLVFGRMATLGDHLGPALLQLPPQLGRDDERLARFLPLVARRGRLAIEFRAPSWYAPPILDLLARHDVALAISDHHAAPSPWEATASFAYLRGHGPSGRYFGRYPQATLERWAAWLRRQAEAGRPCFCYFDNDVKAAAPADAARLLALLDS